MKTRVKMLKTVRLLSVVLLSLVIIDYMITNPKEVTLLFALLMFGLSHEKIKRMVKVED